MPQWYSNGWAVLKRKGVRDGYEVTYKGEIIAAVAVTRAGWKWTAPNPRSRSYRRWSRQRWVWSEDIYPTWQDAVAAYAKRYRRLAVGRGADVPDQWGRSYRIQGRPWEPRPVRDTFDDEEAPDGR